MDPPRHWHVRSRGDQLRRLGQCGEDSRPDDRPRGRSAHIRPVRGHCGRASGMTAQQLAPGRKPGQPVGEQARWRVLYNKLNELEIGGYLSYEDMGLALDLNHLDPRDKSIIYQALRKALDELQDQEHKVFRMLRGHGYQRATATEVLTLAQGHQARAVAEIGAG